MNRKITRNISFYQTKVGRYKDGQVIELGLIKTKKSDEKTVMKEITKTYGAGAFIMETPVEVNEKYQITLEEFMKHALLVVEE